MNINTIKTVVGLGKNYVMARRPEMLLGASVTATIVSNVLSARAGYISGQEVLEAEIDGNTKLTFKEKAQLTWKNYTTPVAVAAGAVGSTAGLHIVHVQEKKVMAAAALAVIDELQEQVDTTKLANRIGLISDEEEQKILAERADANDGVAHTIGSGSEVFTEDFYLVHDVHTGREFYSNENRIQAAINEVNRVLNAQGDVPLNTFYVWAGVPEIERGDDEGWTGAYVDLEWEDSHNKAGKPIRKFKFDQTPRRGYDNVHR